MVGEVFAALQSLKAVTDSAKALVSIRDENTRNLAINDLLRQLVELRGDLMSAQDTQATLTERIRSLEAELVKAKAGAGDLDRYELKAVDGGGTVYMLKPDERGTEPPHWLCPTRYSQGKKSIYQFSTRFSGRRVYRCGGCKGHLSTHGTPVWSE